METTMTCPICETDGAKPCKAAEDEGSYQCANPDCLAKFLPEAQTP